MEPADQPVRLVKARPRRRQAYAGEPVFTDHPQPALAIFRQPVHAVGVGHEAVEQAQVLRKMHHRTVVAADGEAAARQCDAGVRAVLAEGSIGIRLQLAQLFAVAEMETVGRDVQQPVLIFPDIQHRQIREHLRTGNPLRCRIRHAIQPIPGNAEMDSVVHHQQTRAAA
ncbi:hypothetical protein D3C71_1100580 [compost metagenome]